MRTSCDHYMLCSAQFWSKKADFCNSNLVVDICEATVNVSQSNQQMHCQEIASGNTAREALTRYVTNHFPLHTGDLHQHLYETHVS